MTKKPLDDNSLAILAAGMSGGAESAIDMIGAINRFENEEVFDRVPVNIRTFTSLTRDEARMIMQEWGCEFGEMIDKHFIKCKFPAGWHWKHSNGNWTNLLDDEGRVRANRFYCSNFWEFDAFINLNKPFHVSNKYIEGDKPPFVQAEAISSNGEVVFTSATHYFYQAPSNGSGEEHNEKVRRMYNEMDEQKEVALNECRAWLDKNHPKWDSFTGW